MIERVKIKDVIKKLQELDDDEITIGFEVTPDISCIENYDGDGWETSKYIYTITIETEEKTRRYKRNGAMKKYIKENE